MDPTTPTDARTPEIEALLNRADEVLKTSVEQFYLLLPHELYVLVRDLRAVLGRRSTQLEQEQEMERE